MNGRVKNWKEVEAGVESPRLFLEMTGSDVAKRATDDESRPEMIREALLRAVKMGT